MTPSAVIVAPPPHMTGVMEGSSYYLHPGKLFASTTPAVVTTILGSCVAVCLFDATTARGGMNHFLLPHWAGGDAASLRYGNVAINMLIERLLESGAERASLQAKVFGGAAIMKAFGGEGRDHVGTQNAQIAQRLLGDEGIPIVASDVGGNRGRKLVFHTDSGAAFLKYV